MSVLLAATIPLVNVQVSKHIGLPELLEPAKGLASYGLDSLAAVEVRNWIRSALSVELRTLEVSSANTLYSMCEKIVERVMAKE